MKTTRFPIDVRLWGWIALAVLAASWCIPVISIKSGPYFSIARALWELVAAVHRHADSETQLLCRVFIVFASASVVVAIVFGWLLHCLVVIVRARKRGASEHMSTSGELWMRSAGLVALSLCLLLAVVPLYFIGVPEGIGPHWSTVFDLPSDWYLLPSGMIGGRWLPYASVLLMRYAMFLLVGGIIAICVFKRFRLRWLPLLLLGILCVALAFQRFHPEPGDGMVSSLGFGLLVALGVVSLCLVLLHFLCRNQ